MYSNILDCAGAGGEAGGGGSKYKGRPLRGRPFFSSFFKVIKKNNKQKKNIIYEEKISNPYYKKHKK